jgi:hypothetical protein
MYFLLVNGCVQKDLETLGSWPRMSRVKQRINMAGSNERLCIQTQNYDNFINKARMEMRCSLTKHIDDSAMTAI